MLDSERIFKIKVRSHWTVFKILLTFPCNNFVWKRDCPISSKLESDKVDQGHSRNLF